MLFEIQLPHHVGAALEFPSPTAADTCNDLTRLRKEGMCGVKPLAVRGGSCFLSLRVSAPGKHPLQDLTRLPGGAGRSTVLM